MNAARLRSWLPLLLALAWIAVVRVPLVLNAANHLDSDLAVDGLTLADAANGRWRWHYPGTPAIGTPPVLASLPLVLVWGVGPRSLVAGGVVLYLLAVASIYLLTRTTHGPAAASWGLIPLAFASTGMIWLSGRITGGHWLVVGWTAIAFALLGVCLRKGGILPALGMGLWCGLGLYVDRMFLLGLASLVVVAVAGRGPQRLDAPRYDAGLAFLVGAIVGWLPHAIGAWVDPHDAYGEQFVSIFRPIGENRAVLGVAWEQAGTLLVEHARILGRACLPRLVAGHQLPGLETDPAVAVFPPLAAAWSIVALLAFSAGLLGLFVRAARAPAGSVAATVSRGLALLTAAVVAGFLLNRNIFNADNYRYLVLLVVPGSVGFGLVMRGLASRPVGRAVAAGIAILFALLATADTLAWYRGLGWVEGLRPTVARPRPDPALAWLRAHPEITEIHGRYWEVYRLAFLADRPIRAVPWPDEPRRYPPSATPRRVGDRDAVALLIGRTPLTAAQVEEIRRHVDEELLRQPGLTIYRWR